MSVRRHVVFIVVATLASMGASYRTVNFVVEAPTPQIAQQIANYAEVYRKQKAIDWLGHEIPPWPEPCPLHVTVNMGGAGGATSFAFDRGRVLGQHMQMEGSLDRLLLSVLPHEVTHTVFAYYNRMPVPRWADEGGAVLSEGDVERNRHDMICRQILNYGREIPLRRLFSLTQYPGDVMALYAEGFSVVNYLVNSSNKRTFLTFVAHGMNYGWDNAVQTYYHYQSVEELEQAWKAHLQQTKRQPTILAQNGNPSSADPTGRLVARQTNPTLQPTLASVGPTYRGQLPSPEEAGRFGVCPSYSLPLLGILDKTRDVPRQPGIIQGVIVARPSELCERMGYDPVFGLQVVEECRTSRAAPDRGGASANVTGERKGLYEN